MNATERLESELVFHDTQARERAATFERDPSRFVFSDNAYLDHETWIRPAFAGLGDLDGKDILDFGCGHGMAAVVMARHGARVTAFDLSPAYVAEASRRAKANDVAVQFVIADGERLPFADASFDGVWGNAILHHLDLKRTGRELRRVLRPGGVAVFCEPWGENPLLNLARRHLPYPGKGRTPDERPLRFCDVDILRRVFPTLEVRGYQLLSMLRRVLKSGWFMGRLESCDEQLLTRFPSLSRFCRYVVLSLRNV